MRRTTTAALNVGLEKNEPPLFFFFCRSRRFVFKNVSGVTYDRMANLGSHRLGTTSSCSTYTMSRLLHAAARGARVQMTDFDGGWYAVNIVMNTSEDRYRIYPEDEHLQYGPISTALREFADCLPIEKKTATGLPIYLCSAVVGWYNLAETKFGMPRDSGPRACSAADHRSLFLFILAEALADEGL